MKFVKNFIAIELVLRFKLKLNKLRRLNFKRGPMHSNIGFRATLSFFKCLFRYYVLKNLILKADKGKIKLHKLSCFRQKGLKYHQLA